MKKSQLKNIIRESIKQLMSEQPQQGNYTLTNLNLTPCNIPGGHSPTSWFYSFTGWMPSDWNHPSAQTFSNICVLVNDPSGNVLSNSSALLNGPNVSDTSGNTYRMQAQFSQGQSCPNPQLILTAHASHTHPALPDSLPVGDPNGCNPNFSGPVIKCKKNETHPKFGGTCVEVLSDSPSTMPGNPGWLSITNNPNYFDSMYDCKQSDCEQGLSPDSGGGKDPITPLTTTPQSKIIDPEIDRMQKIANIK